MDTLQEQLKVIKGKMLLLNDLVQKLKTENLALSQENADLVHQIESQSQNTIEQSLPADEEHLRSQVMHAKKIKREVEQTLRDAERRLEALRF